MGAALAGDFQLARRRERDGENVSVVLWDLDGTLVQTEHLRCKLENEVLAEFNIDPGPLLEGCAGMRTRDVLTRVLDAKGEGARLPEVMARWHTLVLEHVVNRALPLRGIERVLSDIPMRTHRFALVTSTDHDVADKILERFGWAWRFECVIGGDDVKEGKPAPEPYVLACEKMGVRPENALVVEDSIAGVSAAQAAGCRVAAVMGTELPENLHAAEFVLSNAGALPGLLRMLS